MRWKSEVQRRRERVDRGWHLWFAWYPVCVQRDCWVWLELIWRRYEAYHSVWVFNPQAAFLFREDNPEWRRKHGGC